MGKPIKSPPKEGPELAAESQMATEEAHRRQLSQRCLPSRRRVRKRGRGVRGSPRARRRGGLGDVRGCPQARGLQGTKLGQCPLSCLSSGCFLTFSIYLFESYNIYYLFIHWVLVAALRICTLHCGMRDP